MRRLVRPRFVGALLASMLTTAVAHGYVRTHRESDGKPAAWPAPHVVFTLARASIPKGLDPGKVERAVADALGAWTSDHCSAVELALVTTDEPEPKVARDGINLVIFRNDHWSKNGDPSPFLRYDREELAVTSVYLEKSEHSPRTAAILEADMELDAVDYGWSVDGSGISGDGVRDITRVVMHEVGHALGLEHNCNDGASSDPSLPGCRRAGAAVRGATMFPSWLDSRAAPRELGGDERRALCDIYPRSALASTPPAKPGARGVRFAALVATAVFGSGILAFLMKRGRHLRGSGRPQR